jgi:hypothetical protein
MSRYEEEFDNDPREEEKADNIKEYDREEMNII